ncbi:hypothetical protein KC325_g3 [Hortaea werneckii]|nr:hypothetical protein KC325_g3 [Hortaea werneckii]
MRLHTGQVQETTASRMRRDDKDVIVALRETSTRWTRVLTMRWRWRGRRVIHCLPIFAPNRSLRSRGIGAAKGRVRWYGWGETPERLTHLCEKYISSKRSSKARPTFQSVCPSIVAVGIRCVGSVAAVAARQVSLEARDTATDARDAGDGWTQDRESLYRLHAVARLAAIAEAGSLRCESLKRIGSYTAGTTRSFAVLPRYVFVRRHLIQSHRLRRASLLRDECIREIQIFIVLSHCRRALSSPSRPASVHLCIRS